MEQLQTQFSLEGKWEPVQINFHKAKLPCGMKYLDGVEYDGHRLREGGGARPAERDRAVTYLDNYSAFNSVVDKQTFDGHTLYVSKLQDVNALQSCTAGAYYYTDMGHINTSFSDGKVILYYRGIKTDEDGFPMIPDNQNYKSALYWYCRGMMIGAGWKDTIFKFDYCIQQFEMLYGPRAIAEIRMPSPEQMDKRINTFVRFIPHQGYYDNFFSTPGPEGTFDTRGFGPNTGLSSANSNTQQPYIAGTNQPLS
jgi:hypothetical protein